MGARGDRPAVSRASARPAPPAELDGEPYRRISPFRQVPVIDDDGFVVAESAAVVLYLAEKAGKLIPADVQGRTRVVQWCFAAVSTVEPTLVCLDLIDIFESGTAAHKLREEVRKLAGRWLGDVERRLEDREWIACADFTAADIMMASVLRSIRKTDLMAPLPEGRGLLRALPGTPGLAAHPRPLRRATRRERRRHPLARPFRRHRRLVAPVPGLGPHRALHQGDQRRGGQDRPRHREADAQASPMHRTTRRSGSAPRSGQTRRRT